MYLQAETIGPNLVYRLSVSASPARKPSLLGERGKHMIKIHPSVQARVLRGNILHGEQNPGRKQTLRYIDGKEPPNYPMPALRVNVEILPTRIVCWHRNHGHLDYYYMA